MVGRIVIQPAIIEIEHRLPAVSSSRALSILLVADRPARAEQGRRVEARRCDIPPRAHVGSALRIFCRVRITLGDRPLSSSRCCHAAP